MNLAEPILDEIGATWNFSSPSFVINGKSNRLNNYHEPENHETIATILYKEGN